MQMPCLCSSTYSYEDAVLQFKKRNQLSLPQQDVCKIRKDTKTILQDQDQTLNRSHNGSNTKQCYYTYNRITALGRMQKIWSGGGVLTVFLVINVFQRRPYEPPLRSDWTQGVQLLLEGVRNSISRETYSHVMFPHMLAATASVSSSSSMGQSVTVAFPGHTHLLFKVYFTDQTVALDSATHQFFDFLEGVLTDSMNHHRETIKSN